MPNLNDHPEEFEDWLFSVTLRGQEIQFLCCPEDVECMHHPHAMSRACCDRMALPICNGCAKDLAKPALPPAALANEMMIFYAPKEIYTNNVTVVEMICASVCISDVPIRLALGVFLAIPCVPRRRGA